MHTVKAQCVQIQALYLGGQRAIPLKRQHLSLPYLKEDETQVKTMSFFSKGAQSWSLAAKSQESRPI